MIIHCVALGSLNATTQNRKSILNRTSASHRAKPGVPKCKRRIIRDSGQQSRDPERDPPASILHNRRRGRRVLARRSRLKRGKSGPAEKKLKRSEQEDNKSD